MPDTTSDPYAAMLGEGPSNGILDTVVNYARRYNAQQSGAALEAARGREQARQSEAGRLHDDAVGAAQYGMDEFFTPERVKYAKSLGVDLTGVQSVAQQRKQAMAADEAEFAQMSGAAPGAAGQPAGANPGASGQTPAPGSSAPPASGPKGPMPPMNADDGKPNWHGHDWDAHAQSEPPEEKQAYDKAVFYMNKARHAASFGLPGAETYEKMAAFYGQGYHEMLEKRMGFDTASKLQENSQSFEKYQTQFVQGQENARAKLGHDDALRNLTAGRIQSESDNIGKAITDLQLKLADKSISDPSAVQPMIDSINQRVTHLAGVAKASGMPFDDAPLRQVAKKIPGTWWNPFSSDTAGMQPAASADAEPSAAAAPAKAAAPAAKPKVSTSEGTIISNPKTGERRVLRGGEWVPVDGK